MTASYNGIIFICIFVLSTSNLGLCFATERKARSSFASAGLEALTVLLKGADKMYTRQPNTVKYMKHGDLETALRDFYAIKGGSEIREFEHKKGMVLVRRVGNKQVSLLTGGGRWELDDPTMEITEHGRQLIKIVYKE